MSLKNHIITEMAVSLKEYKKRVDGLRFQLVENWCLLEYCRLYDPSNININHWKTELKACINNLKYLNIKSHTNKQKVLTKALIEDYDYDDVDMIFRIIEDKFGIEGIVNQVQIINICKNFTKAIKEIIYIISIDGLSTEKYLQQWSQI